MMEEMRLLSGIKQCDVIQKNYYISIYRSSWSKKISTVMREYSNMFQSNIPFEEFLF